MDAKIIPLKDKVYYWHKVKHIYPTKLIGTTARNYV